MSYYKKLFSDVSYVSIMDYGRELQGLICKAHRVGFSMQVAADGYLPSRRHNFAMGLASMHIAQLLDVSVLTRGKSITFCTIHTIQCFMKVFAKRIWWKICACELLCLYSKPPFFFQKRWREIRLNKQIGMKLMLH